MDRLVLSEIIGPFIGSVFLFTSLILASGELVRLAEYLQTGESVMLVAELLGYMLPSIFSLTFPIAMLLATLLGVSRLSSDSELVALVSAGANFERIMLPIGIFGLFVSFIGIWFTNSVVPNANAKKQNIIDNVSRQGNVRVTDAFTRRVHNDDTGMTLVLHAEGGISLNERQAGTATLKNLTIEEWEKGSMKSVIFARQADWEIGTNNWLLNGTIYGADFTSAATPALITADSLKTMEAPLGKPDELQSLKEVRAEDVPTRGLQKRSKLFRQSGDISSARDADIEVARRIALPFASFVFALVGAPLGVRPPRSGRQVSFGLAVIITFVYWTMLQLFTVVGRSGVLPPWFAVMLPNLLGLAVGLYLVRRVMRS